MKTVLFISLFTVVGLKAFAQLDDVTQHYDSLEKEAKHAPQTIQFVQEKMNLVEDYSQLHQIILLRHGNPAVKKGGWRKRKEAIAYIQAYDSVPIFLPDFTPISLQDNELNIIHTSSINRAISTAAYVFDREGLQIANPLFREFERKIFAFPNVKLPLKWWLTGSRILWFMGLNKKGIERFSNAKTRAKQAANILEKDAFHNQKTLLVAHGLLNHYLVKYLKKKGWTISYDGGKGYLSQKLLVKYGN